MKLIIVTCALTMYGAYELITEANTVQSMRSTSNDKIGRLPVWQMIHIIITHDTQPQTVYTQLKNIQLKD